MEAKRTLLLFLLLSLRIIFEILIHFLLSPFIQSLLAILNLLSPRHNISCSIFAGFVGVGQVLFLETFPALSSIVAAINFTYHVV